MSKVKVMKDPMSGWLGERRETPVSESGTRKNDPMSGWLGERRVEPEIAKSNEH